MPWIKAHFDGKVIVPHEPLDLPANTQLIITVVPDADLAPIPGTVEGIQEFMTGFEISEEDAKSIKSSIDENYTQTNPDPQ